MLQELWYSKKHDDEQNAEVGRKVFPVPYTLPDGRVVEASYARRPTAKERAQYEDLEYIGHGTWLPREERLPTSGDME